MERESLSILCCPKCKNELTFQKDLLFCLKCQRNFLIKDEIPRFIKTEELIGRNRKIEKLYNLFAPFYSLTFKLLFLLIGGEEKARRECLNWLEIKDNFSILETSIGAGDDLLYFKNKKLKIYGLDISIHMLRKCKENLRKWNLEAELFLGNAEELPFKNNSFDVVYHIGGINFFEDKKAAIDEMIRVAKPGSQILIVDETEKMGKIYDLSLFRLFIRKREKIIPPLDLIPKEMEDVKLDYIWKDFGYSIKFRKP